MNTKIDKIPADAPETVPSPRKIDVDPKRCQIVESNQSWRTVLVRMPKDSISDDLRNPAIWRLTQQSRECSLAKLDHLYILGYDESWFARAVVSAAGHDTAELVVERVGSFREQQTSHYTDGIYEVVWGGEGYQVRRIGDGAAMGSVAFNTVAAAIHYIHTSLTSRKVA